MKNFVKKLILYFIPILGYIVFCEYRLLKNNEVISINEVVNQQLNNKTEKYYFRKFFDNSTSLYKITMAEKKRPEILVVGQSTVLEFRDVMFHPLEEMFYNIGPTITNTEELHTLVKLIKDGKLAKPKVLIIGLDLSLVKKTNNLKFNGLLYPHKDEIYQAKYHAAAAQTLIKYIFQNGSTTADSIKYQGFGYLGLKGTGYRKDGSLRYGQDIANYLINPVYYDEINYKALLNNKEYIFTDPFEIDLNLVQGFMIALKQLKQMGIQTLVFFPPVSNDFFTYFSKNKDFYRCFKQYLGIQDTLKKYHFDFIPFSTPQKLGLPDNYMLDGIHPSEVLVGIILKQYLAHNTHGGLLAKVDILNLKQLITSKQTIPLSFMRDSAVFIAIKQK